MRHAISGMVLFVMVCCAAGWAAAAQQEPAEPAPAAAPAERVDPAKVAAAIRQLGAAEFAEREAAVNKLLTIGLPAVPALKKAAEGGDPEVETRARETLDLLALGITADTPEALRKLAAGVVREPDERVRAIGLSQLAAAGPPGWHVLQCLRWCHDVPEKAITAALPQILGGTLPEAVAAGHMDRVLTALSIESFGKVKKLDAYVGTCLMEGVLPDALARAEAWYGLRPRRESALLVARLNWTMDRRPEAVRWARTAVADLKSTDEFPHDALRDALSLLIAAGDMEGVAAFCERGAEVGLSTEEHAFKDPRLRLYGVAALAAHLAGDAERRDRDIETLRKVSAEVKAAAEREGNSHFWRGMSLSVYDIMVLCRLSDRAVQLAIEQKDDWQAALLLTWQGRTAEAEPYAEKARQAEREETAENEPEPTTLEGWRRAASIAGQAGDQKAKVAALRKAIALVGPETKYRTAYGLYWHLIAAELAEEAAAFAARLIDRESQPYAPEIVASVMTGGDQRAGAWCVLLERMRPDAAPKELVDRAIEIGAGKMDKEAVLELAREAADFGRAHAGEQLVHYGRRSAGYPPRPEPRVHLHGAEPLPSVLDLLSDTCKLYDLTEEAIRYLTESAEAAKEDRGRSRRAAWMLAGEARWEQAAESFARAYKARPSAELRYYRGRMLTLAGQAEEGARARALAVREARATAADLVDVMLRVDDLDVALREWRTQRRIGFPRLGLPVSLFLLAELIGDYRQAYADRCLQILGYGLFGGNSYDPEWFCTCASYLDVNGALARMQAGEEVDVDALCEHWQRTAADDQEGAIHLVRGLDQLGHREQADRVYAAAAELARAGLAEKPDAPQLRCNWLWFAGMCGRDLDEAMRVGEALLAKAPEDTYVLDNFATACFSRGEYERAVDLEARAAARFLDSGSHYASLKSFHLAQLARFRAALAAEQERTAGEAKEE